MFGGVWSSAGSLFGLRCGVRARSRRRREEGGCILVVLTL